MRSLRQALAAATLALALPAVCAHAAVIIIGTRVIYPGGSRDLSVRLQNRGDRPALIQAWLDRGDPKSTPDAVSVPFALSPSLARIDPDRGQVLRLTYTGEPLPQDKESVFWLNMLEVPPKPTAADGTNILQFALRTRIKVFFRPRGLKDDAAVASKSLQWQLVRSGDSWAVEARNPSPYFISFAALALHADANAADAPATSAGGMVAPGETQRFEFTKAAFGISAGGQVLLRYTVINDYGGFDKGEATLSVPGRS